MLLERAELVAFDSASYTATVRYEQSLSTVQSGVPVARHVPVWQLKTGDRLVVAVFDALVASDRCVIGVMGVTRRAPGCRVYRSTNQSIANATVTLVSFSGVHDDTDGMWDPAAPTRLTIQTPGRYHVGFLASFAASTGGTTRYADLRASNVGVWPNRIGLVWLPPRGGGAPTHLPPVEGEWTFAAGDYVEVGVYQDSGGPLDLLAFSEPMSIELWAHWIEA
ncbi:MAG: hypothetical protein KatS3mg060_0381 [Dehalococcoidia bacterium]|nr:MAG: hypothetical protein KatS3mg060_0381 [Dehalococcoidia bacterium]